MVGRYWTTHSIKALVRKTAAEMGLTPGGGSGSSDYGNFEQQLKFFQSLNYDVSVSKSLDSVNILSGYGIRITVTEIIHYYGAIIHSIYPGYKVKLPNNVINQIKNGGILIPSLNTVYRPTTEAAMPSAYDSFKASFPTCTKTPDLSLTGSVEGVELNLTNRPETPTSQYYAVNSFALLTYKILQNMTPGYSEGWSLDANGAMGLLHDVFIFAKYNGNPLFSVSQTTLTGGVPALIVKQDQEIPDGVIEVNMTYYKGV